MKYCYKIFALHVRQENEGYSLSLEELSRLISSWDRVHMTAWADCGVTVLGQWLDYASNCQGSVLGSCRDFSLRHRLQTSSAANPGFTLVIKRQGREANCSLNLEPKSRNLELYLQPPLCRHVVVVTDFRLSSLEQLFVLSVHFVSETRVLTVPLKYYKWLCKQ